MPETFPSYGSQFSIQFSRLLAATGCRTQIELTTLLHIRQSSIAVAQKQNAIPQSWLRAISRLGIDPCWILTGNGPEPNASRTEWERFLCIKKTAFNATATKVRELRRSEQNGK